MILVGKAGKDAITAMDKLEEEAQERELADYRDYGKSDMNDKDYARVQEIKAEIKTLEKEKCALFLKVDGRMKQNFKNHSKQELAKEVGWID